MDQGNLKRINELAALAKTRELTPEELSERDERRKKYLAAFRAQFRDQLEHTVIQREDGTKEAVKDRRKK